jgi:hypothetical protein
VKIFIAALPAPHWDGVAGVALREDGVLLAQHISSDANFAQFDMGITSKRKHDVYQRECPDGYELEWVPIASTHPGYQAALAKNRAAVSEPPE